MTESLIEKLIAFAQEDERIVALTKDNDPEDDQIKSEIYYFIVNGK